MTVEGTPGVRRVEQIMGTPIVVDVRDEIDEEALDRMFSWFHWVDATFSTYDGGSEISRLNRGELELARAHPEVREIVGRCESLRVRTGGWFDARAASPELLDPSGLVKGWSVDRAALVLEQAGARNYAISAGGDMRVRGRAVPELVWRVGIQHPHERDQVVAVVETDDLAIATSGAYARGHHVLDPHTRRPPRGTLSVTVVGADLGTADAFATAAFAMGEAAPAWTAGLEGYEAMTILAEGSVFKTGGFPA